MLQKLRHINLLQPRVVTGVEILVDTPKEKSFRYTQIKNYYGTITIKKSDDGLIDIERLTDEIGKNKNIPFSANPPLVVNFSGKQVIIKKINDFDEDDDSKLLQKTLPGARLADFYLQTYQSENEVFTAVIKKDIVDETLNELKEKGFYIQSVLLGPFTALAFEEQLIKNNVIELPSNKIVLNSSGIQEISSEETKSGANVLIGDESISFESILSFASAFSFYNANSDIIECSTEIIPKERGEIKFGLYQIALLRTFLWLVLFIAMTNYFLGRNYTEAYESLQDATSEQKNTFMLFQAQQQELVNRINLLNNTGVSSRGDLAFYADRIGILTPKSIQLLELKIVPITKKMKNGDRIEMDPSKITIKGVAPVSLDLNEWVLKLENESWIGETVIINYSQTDREYPGIFDLEIGLNG